MPPPPPADSSPNGTFSSASSSFAAEATVTTPDPLRSPAQDAVRKVRAASPPKGASAAMPIPEAVDVVILGAGPTGLVTAIALSMQGLTPLVLDLNMDSVNDTRAHFLLPASVRYLERLKVPVRSRGVPVRGLVLNINGRSTSDISLEESAGAAGDDGSPPISLPQSELETMLLDRLQDLGVTVHRPIAGYRVEVPQDRFHESASTAPLATAPLVPGTVMAAAGGSARSLDTASFVDSFLMSTERLAAEAAASTDDADESMFIDRAAPGRQTRRGAEESERPYKLHLTLINAYGAAVRGPTESVQCRFIVGADGPQSIVRRSLAQVEWIPKGPPAEYLVADASLEWGVPDMTNDKAHLRQTNNGALTAIPLGGSKWRIVCIRDFCAQAAGASGGSDLESSSSAMAAPSNHPYAAIPVAVPDPKELHQILTVLVPGTELHEVTSATAFTLQPAVASAFVKGSAVLVGDAAHVLCPVFSPSLNLGIADALAISWRIVAALKGGAAPALLRSYEVERMFAAEAALDASTQLLKLLLKARAASRVVLSVISPLMQGNGMLGRSLRRMALPECPVLPSHRPETAMAPASMLDKCPSLAPGVLLCPVKVQQLAHGSAAAVTWDCLAPVGSHCLFLCLRVLPKGTRLRTLFGCERKEEAARWNGAAIAALARFAKLAAQSLQQQQQQVSPVTTPPTPSSPEDERAAAAAVGLKERLPKHPSSAAPLMLVWLLTGLGDSTFSADQVPARLQRILNHVSTTANSVYCICVDHTSALPRKMALQLSEPHARNGDERSASFVLVRPDNVVAANGYAGDATAVGSALNYISRIQLP